MTPDKTAVELLTVSAAAVCDAAKHIWVLQDHRARIQDEYQRAMDTMDVDIQNAQAKYAKAVERMSVDSGNLHSEVGVYYEEKTQLQQPDPETDSDFTKYVGRDDLKLA